VVCQDGSLRLWVDSDFAAALPPAVRAAAKAPSGAAATGRAMCLAHVLAPPSPSLPPASRMLASWACDLQHGLPCHQRLQWLVATVMHGAAQTDDQEGSRFADVVDGLSVHRSGQLPLELHVWAISVQSPERQSAGGALQGFGIVPAPRVAAVLWGSDAQTVWRSCRRTPLLLRMPGIACAAAGALGTCLQLCCAVSGCRVLAASRTGPPHRHLPAIFSPDQRALLHADGVAQACGLCCGRAAASRVCHVRSAMRVGGSARRHARPGTGACCHEPRHGIRGAPLCRGRSGGPGHSGRHARRTNTAAGPPRCAVAAVRRVYAQRGTRRGAHHLLPCAAYRQHSPPWLSAPTAPTRVADLDQSDVLGVVRTSGMADACRHTLWRPSWPQSATQAPCMSGLLSQCRPAKHWRTPLHVQ
jgi:hypothetical protein